MSNKNNRILNPEGGRYPFKVSDEYFDNLTARIMAKVDEAEQQNGNDHSKEEAPAREGAKLLSLETYRSQQRKRWLSIVSIAASLVLVVTLALQFIPKSTTLDPTDEPLATYTTDDYNEDLMTYTMVDNMDVYYYLSSGGDMNEEDY